MATDFLSAYGRPSDRLNAIKGLLGGYTGESSVLSQMGDYLNSHLGLANIKSITPVQGSQGTTYMVTANDGQQYAMTAPGTRQGDGAYVARPENLSAGKVSYGESFGGGADNQGAAMDADPTFSGGWQNTLDNPIYLSKYTDGMDMPKVTYDPTAYSDQSLLQGIAPYLAVAAPAIVGAFAPGLMESLGAGSNGVSEGLAASTAGGGELGWLGTPAEAASGLGGYGAGSSAVYGAAAPVVTDGIPGVDFEVPQSDLNALMDSPAGGGGTTADWWKQSISPSSNYSIKDLIRTAIPAEWLPTGGTDKLLEKSLGLLTQGQQPTGGLLGGSSGYKGASVNPYAANPLAFRQSQYSKIFGE